MNIVLASASPRRRELLKNAGVEFTVRPANIAEIQLEGEAPRAFAERMAREKAQEVWEKLMGTKPKLTTKDTKLHEGATELKLTTKDTKVHESRTELNEAFGRGNKEQSVYVLGADTVVVVGDRVLGKPEDEKDAAEMLCALSGRQHHVITGVCFIGRGFEDIRSEITAVQFSKISEQEVCEYVKSGEPMDKAGAYAIQGGASRWIEKIEGDYSNVVGLPVEMVLRMLREHGAL